MVTHATIIIGLMLLAWAWPHVIRIAVLLGGGMMDANEQQPPDDELDSIGGLAKDPRRP